MYNELVNNKIKNIGVINKDYFYVIKKMYETVMDKS